MKEIDEKDAPDVSGGRATEGGCIPSLPTYPTKPGVPITDPLPGTTEDPL